MNAWLVAAIVIAISTLAGAAINFMGIKPISTLVFAAMINGLLAPPLLAALTRITSDARVMGRHVNTRSVTWLAWATTVIMAAIAVVMLAVTFHS